MADAHKESDLKAAADGNVDTSAANNCKNEGKKARQCWIERSREMKSVKRNRNKRNKDQHHDRKEWINTSEDNLRNVEFEKYYIDQRICPEDEWDEFIKCCRAPLRASFRFNTCVPLWRTTIRRIIGSGMQHPELGLAVSINHDREYIKMDKGTSLYYHLSPNKVELRKNEHSIGFREDLVAESIRGSLTRQETVSMLPIIYLNPQPHQNILDLCAAPGMKYLQILDEVGSALIYRCGSLPSENKGMIVANDVCQKRVSTLSHNVKGMSSPSAAVTNYDASRYPTLYNSKGQKILFDSILADVPCSCDGTTRKASDIWKSWKSTGGLHMHKLQLSILKRALKLLKVGGTMVYSTCSLNPLENEAIASYVVSEGYREYGVMIQPIEKIQGLKAAAGLTNWLVPNPDGGYFESYDQVPLDMRVRITPSMFKSQEWDESHAQNVIRILPHHNDTGGFFLFKLKKVVSREANTTQLDINTIEDVIANTDMQSISLKSGSKLLHEYLMYKESNPDEFDRLCQFYGIEGKHRDDLGRVLATKRHSRTSCSIISQENATLLFHKRKEHQTQCTGDDKGHQDTITKPEVMNADNIEADMASSKSVKRYASETKCSNRKTWERCKYTLLGMRAFTKLESKSIQNSFCNMRVSQEATMVLMFMIKRRIMFANMAFCEDAVNGNIHVKRLLEHEREGNISSLDTCRKDGVLECGGCIVVIVPQWKRNRIPTNGITVDRANGIVFAEKTTDSTDTGAVSPVSDVLDTMPTACVLSDAGSIFTYAPPQVVNLLKSMVGT